MEYLITFIEGIISFISPCMLPLLPVYISFIAGGEDKKQKSLPHALGFCAGFTALFMLLGLFAGTVGRFLRGNSRVFDIICGILVILFGVMYLADARLPFLRPLDGSGIRRGTVLSSALFGIIYAINLTPCTGAFLGSALLLASTSGGMLKGALLLFAYSLGLAVPFILSALVIGQLSRTLGFVRKNYRIINILCGCFLIIVGLLMIFGVFGRLMKMLV